MYDKIMTGFIIALLFFAVLVVIEAFFKYVY
jgi:hypothetical protein